MLRDILFAGLFFVLGAVFMLWVFYRAGKAKRESLEEIEQRLTAAIRSVEETRAMLTNEQATDQRVIEAFERARRRGIYPYQP